MIDLTERNSQKSSLGAFALRYSFKKKISTFNLFLCLVYVYICFFRLVLCFLYFFKHVRLLDLSFQVLLCFFACLFSGLGFRCVCIHIQLACIRRPMYAHTSSCPKTLILIFLFLLLCLFYLICLCFSLLICF